MTPYLQKPTREWTDAAQLRIGKLQDRADGIRSLLDCCKLFAGQIRDECPMSNLSYDNADALATFIEEALSDYLGPLERSLKDDAEEVSDG